MDAQGSLWLELLVLITLVIVAYFAACQPKGASDESEKRDA